MLFKSEKRPSKAAWNYKQRLEMEYNEYQRLKKIHKQIKDLNKIKEKMIETKLKNECLKFYKRKANYEVQIEELMKRNFNTTLIKGRIAKAMTKIFETKDILNKYNMRQIDNRLKIIKKLADEYGSCNNKKKQKTSIDSVSFEKVEEEHSSLNFPYSSILSTNTTRSSLRGKRHSSIKTFSKNHFSTSRRKSRLSRSSTDRSSNQSHMRITPDRIILSPENIPGSILYKNKKIIDDILNEENEYEYLSGIDTLDVENDISIKPSVVKFNEFTKGHYYSQKIIVQNRSLTPLKCIFIQLEYFEDVESSPLEIEVFDKIQLLFPYTTLSMIVNFKPQENKIFKGKILFHTVRPDCRKKQFEIKIECIPIFNAITIKPTNLKFEQTPFWKFNKISLKKYISIKNNFGDTLYIRVEPYYQNYKMNENDSLSNIFSEYIRFISTKKVLDAILKRVSNVFDICTTYIEIPPGELVKIPCVCKNISHEGMFVDYFKLFLYTDVDCNNLISDKTIKTEINCTGYNFEFDKLHIDFHICIINFGNYQESIKITNKSNLLLKCIAKVPKSMKTFINIFPVTGFISAKTSQVFYLRFSPGSAVNPLNRHDLERNKYFNFEKLSFPINMCISSSEHKDLKPRKIPVYAVIYFPSIQIEINNEGVTKVLNLGQVTTKETVLVQLRMYNTSILSEEYGFVNLPSYVHIYPTYGFGKLYPNEFYDFLMFYSPDVDDMIDSSTDLPDITAENNFHIKINTIYQDANKNFNGSKYLYDKYGDDDLTVAFFESTIINPLFEFDYQYIRTNYTPCESFSLSVIHLRLNESIKHCRKIKNIQGSFFLDTNSDEIKAQPRIGSINSNTKSIKIIIQCTPKVPIEIYQNVKSQFKTSSPKEKDKRKTNFQPRFDILQEVWKYLNPYTIDVTINCRLKYTHIRHEELLMCRVVCPVTKPDFILTNITSQKIVFGGQPIGYRSYVTVNIKNISGRKIALNIPYLCPNGPFTCSLSKKLTMLPYQEYKFNISFEPIINQHYYEYMEIQSGLTLVPLALIGYGIVLDLSWSPAVIHRETFDDRQNSSPKAIFEIRNHMECAVHLKLDIGLRLKGHLSEKEYKQVKKSKQSKEQPSKQSFSEAEEKAISTFETCFINNITHRIYGIDQNSFIIKPKSKAEIHVIFEKPTASRSITSPIKLNSSQSKTVASTNAYLIKYNLLMGKQFITDFIFLVKVKNK